jgi:hypothetical protein
MRPQTIEFLWRLAEAIERVGDGDTLSLHTKTGEIAVGQRGEPASRYLGLVSGDVQLGHELRDLLPYIRIILSGNAEIVIRVPSGDVEHCSHNVPLSQPCSQCNATAGATPDICPACGEPWPLAVDYDRITCQTCLARGVYQTIPLDDFTTIVEKGGVAT